MYILSVGVFDMPTCIYRHPLRMKLLRHLTGVIRAYGQVMPERCYNKTTLKIEFNNYFSLPWQRLALIAPQWTWRLSAFNSRTSNEQNLLRLFDNGLNSTASCNHREIKELGQQLNLEFSTVKVRPWITCHDQLYTCQVYNYSYVN